MRGMKRPNAENAVIAADKRIHYLLNTEHKRGGSKAIVLQAFGYSADTWQRLTTDLHTYHLLVDVLSIRQTAYGERFDIRAELQTPVGRPLMVRSIRQIDSGTDYPRRITLFPDSCEGNRCGSSISVR